MLPRVTLTMYVGGLILSAATVLGAAQAGLLSWTAYRLVRKRGALIEPLKEELGEVVESFAQTVSRAIVRPTSGTSIALRVAEVGGIALLGYRMLKKLRRKSAMLSPNTMSASADKEPSSSSAVAV
jgi:hypothetical protein